MIQDSIRSHVEALRFSSPSPLLYCCHDPRWPLLYFDQNTMQQTQTDRRRQGIPLSVKLMIPVPFYNVMECSFVSLAMTKNTLRLPDSGIPSSQFLDISHFDNSFFVGISSIIPNLLPD